MSTLTDSAYAAKNAASVWTFSDYWSTSSGYATKSLSTYCYATASSGAWPDTHVTHLDTPDTGPVTGCTSSASSYASFAGHYATYGGVACDLATPKSLSTCDFATATAFYDLVSGGPDPVIGTDGLCDRSS